MINEKIRMDKMSLTFEKFLAFAAALTACSIQLGASPVNRYPTHGIKHFRKSIIRYTNAEINYWMNFESANNMRPGGSMDRLRLRYILKPNLMKNQLEINRRKEMIARLEDAIIVSNSRKKESRRYPSLIYGYKSDKFFIEGSYLKAYKMQEVVVRISAGKFRRLVVKNKGRTFNADLSYDGILSQIILAEIYFLMHESQGESAAKSKKIRRRFISHKKIITAGTMRMYLTLLILRGDKKKFKEVILNDLKTGKSRTRIFLSKEVSAINFEYFKEHAHWIKKDFLDVIKRLEKKVERKLPSCKAVSIFYRCVPWP